jgi:hypothetical protein
MGKNVLFNLGLCSSPGLFSKGAGEGLTDIAGAGLNPPLFLAQPCLRVRMK